MDKVNSEDCFADEEEGGYDAVVVGSGYGGSVAACRMSLAGFKVCLMEKGKKWEAQDFPTNSWQVLSALRMENRSLGISFGPRDALFQVHVQNDSVAAVACGLGGGSLVNAGVMLRTPIRARRNPKWPKEWETDWETCEASASTMLRIQSVPTQFPTAKIMQELTDEENDENNQNSVNLSINFDIEEQPITTRKSKEDGSCLACGNCLTGCPYNAKNSTDKNYLVSAFQAGCTIKTECQVMYVVKNPNDIYKDGEESKSKKRRRRWLVFLNEIDFVEADFVILSAGVFGTANILFQSRMRGLSISERLGSGFSCNGNNVAYLEGSTVPLSGYGLDKKQISTIPFEQRPGPSISSSYTSSLGFTVQPAVLSTAYPYLLFKGIVTYGWPSGYWFLHGIIDKLKHTLGLNNHQAVVLNAMGHDDSDGKITFEKDTNRISFLPPHDPQLPRKIDAFQKLTRKLGGILYMSRYRSTSVHLLGGCNASLDPSKGVCNSKGQVFDNTASSASSVHDGLYVCDASLIPCSVGINPCLTIATASEHVSRHLVQDMLDYKHRGRKAFLEKANHRKSGSVNMWKLDDSSKSEILFKEIMRGRVGGMPCRAFLTVKMNPRPTSHVNDKRTMLIGKSHPLLRGKVGGYVEFKALETDRLYVVDGEVDLCEVDIRTPYTQYMHYHLVLAASSGSRYILDGKKIMNPYLLGLCGWKESTTMYVTLKKESKNKTGEEMLNLKGELHISMIELLKSVISMKGGGRAKFVWLLLQSLLRTYILQIPRGYQKGLDPVEFVEGPYPISTFHEIKTEDGFIISCRQWKCTQNQRRLEGERPKHPILLINGHSTESYWLPTEPIDLVRTLLEAGHETWLLQPRLHPSNCSDDFTIEDIGRFDIPCAINTILGVHGKSIKVHVVAHCVGGLAIHIALMGGHISATKIASLSCTNSSMFFKLTPSSIFKMWLPLIPMSMRILGESNVVPLFKTIKATSRQKLLKLIARLIPRPERCTYDECEVLSGIFGNAFWHSNVTPTLHHWMNKKSLPMIPMAAFPHLRKICIAGFIVDSKGNNSYMIHPERMSLPTLYISGGRTLLVTPKTSFLANKYMKLHQPSYRHERVVVDGFGHSDLLIGEESCKKVFPHILSHIEKTENERISEGSGNGMKYSEKVLAWGDDPFEEGKEGLESWISPVVTFWFLFLLSVMIVYMCLGLF